MKSVASAPGKVILFGEHFIVYGGKAILCSIDKRITVESELLDSDKIKITSNLGSLETSLSQPTSEIESLFRPVAYIAQKVLKRFHSKSGVKISIKSDIPAGVGLGSSSACCVAAASSILGLFSESSKEDVLSLALEAERTIFERASGADTTVCTYGGMLEYSSDSIRKLEFTPKFNLVIADSKIIHSTNKVVSQVRQYKEQNPAKFQQLGEQEAQLIEEALDGLRQNDLTLIGKKMNQNQKYLQEIGVSNEILDSMIEAVQKTTYGSKITGAGDGGCTISMSDENNIDRTIDVLRAKGYDCFSAQIDTEGVIHTSA